MILTQLEAYSLKFQYNRSVLDALKHEVIGEVNLEYSFNNNSFTFISRMSLLNEGMSIYDFSVHRTFKLEKGEASKRSLEVLIEDSVRVLIEEFEDKVKIHHPYFLTPTDLSLVKKRQLREELANVLVNK